MIDLILLLFSLSTSVVLTGRFRDYLLKKNLLDRPNARSSHTIPVPRGGGLAILVIIIPILIVLILFSGAIFKYTGLLAGLSLLAFISWLDDRRGLGALTRLSVHLLAAFLGVTTLSGGEPVFGGYLPFVIDRLLTIILWAGFMNIYNFMDGIDGITGTETIIIATGILVVWAVTGQSEPFVQHLCWLLIGVSAGFLWHNWHPAKIFLGDVGSIPLGYLTGFGLLTLATHGYRIAAMVIPLYYLADGGLTICKRAWRGEKIWQAHREHFYQHAAQGAGRHDKVVMTIIFGNLVLIGSAYISTQNPQLGLAFGLAAAMVTLYVLYAMSKSKTARS